MTVLSYMDRVRAAGGCEAIVTSESRMDWMKCINAKSYFVGKYFAG